MADNPVTGTTLGDCENKPLLKILIDYLQKILYNYIVNKKSN